MSIFYRFIVLMLVIGLAFSVNPNTSCKPQRVTFEAECTGLMMRAANPFDYSEPFDYEYDDGFATLSLSAPVENMCEALRIQAEHACSLESVEFYVFNGGSLEVHIWDVDSLRKPSTHELIPSFLEVLDSAGFGGWEEILLPTKIYLPPLGECFVGRKIITPLMPTLYLSRMVDTENRSYLYIPSSRQWLPPSYTDSTGSWYVTYLIRAHGWYYNIPDETLFDFDTSFITSTNLGVALCDCDADSDPDLATGSQIYRNDSGTFRIVAGTGISGIGYPFWGDFDLDGEPDIFFCSGIGTDKLYANGGTGYLYHDVTSPAGDIANDYITEAAAWLDYDKDGDLDIYVTNSASFDSTDSIWTFYPDLFYRNEGAYFTNVTDAAGIGLATSTAQYGAGIALGDWNNDSWTDIYVANGHNFSNYLWQNNGDGTFGEVAFFYGVDGYNEGGGIYGNSMGACFGDIDNDGDMDLFVANESPAFGYSTADRSFLYINEGPPYFYMTDQRAMRGISNHNDLSVPCFIDYNNDGWLDIFATAMAPGNYAVLYKNNADGTFTDVTEESGLILNGASAAGWGDIDMDGYLDLVVELGREKLVYKNKTATITSESNNWARFKLDGADGNKLGIGTRIYLFAGGISQLREIGAQYGGLHSQSEPIAHFGIGEEVSIDSVVIQWNSGAIERVYDVLPNFNYHWLEGTHGIEDKNLLPAKLSVSSHPNPFNGACKIDISNTTGPIELEIFDILGKKVHSENIVHPAKNTTIIWTPNNSLSGGVYFARIATLGRSLEQKLLYIK
ncbi:VCBS repeat-containing protein [bacterium]|nr:VCBS repeat-containing protein [bacterium]